MTTGRTESSFRGRVTEETGSSSLGTKGGGELGSSQGHSSSM